MDLKPYFFGLSTDEREVFAAACGTTVKHLRNCAYGSRTPSADLAVAIEAQSSKAVTRQEMFPGTFAKTWPELAPVPA